MPEAFVQEFKWKSRIQNKYHERKNLSKSVQEM